jgi:hypothetical protein
MAKKFHNFDRAIRKQSKQLKNSNHLLHRPIGYLLDLLWMYGKYGIPMILGLGLLTLISGVPLPGLVGFVLNFTIAFFAGWSVGTLYINFIDFILPNHYKTRQADFVVKQKENSVEQLTTLNQEACANIKLMQALNQEARLLINQQKEELGVKLQKNTERSKAKSKNIQFSDTAPVSTISLFVDKNIQQEKSKESAADHALDTVRLTA